MDKLRIDVRKKKTAVHIRRSLRRRAYRNRVDIVNSTNETLWFNVFNATDKNIKHPLIANADVDVNMNANLSIVSLFSSKDTTSVGKSSLPMNERELQSLTPIRPNRRKSVNRSVPWIILVIYRSKELSSHLMHRTVTSGATWEIFQETLDDYNGNVELRAEHSNI